MTKNKEREILFNKVVEVIKYCTWDDYDDCPITEESGLYALGVAPTDYFLRTALFDFELIKPTSDAHAEYLCDRIGKCVTIRHLMDLIADTDKQ